MHSTPDKSTIKYVFLVFNSIWFISGLVLVIIGTILKTNYKLIIGDGMEMLIKEVPNSTIMIFIFVGVIIAFVSLLGYCGTAMTDSCLLYSYCVITVLLLIVQCIGIALAFNFSNQLESEAHKLITKAIKEYDWNQIQELNQQSAIDSLQNILKCCGAIDFKDWNLNEQFKDNQTHYPFSCCHNVYKDNYSVNCTVDKANQTIGCVKAIDERLNHKVQTLGGVSILVSIIQVIITILALMLANEIRKYQSL